ncbi:hypothetical protein QJS10_CPB13g00331 [Acorus calamus]|uniref:Shugoshin C-terminal domain-containing protein n=1 Tax=Acorus calamus TaxID=4465 RepID=A0AAV9DGN1_ACOCL|nr:hypothetical protein QJS10_CPB13g00331 [Acorus calamus]
MVNGRRKLSNITNTVQPLSVPSIPKDDGVDRLKKDKTAMMVLIAERNKTIEMKNVEIQKLQFELQSACQQNRLLALTNSQMLMEFNLGKDRLKAMQHELGCVKAVLKVKTLELEEMAKKKQCIEVTVDKLVEVPMDDEMTEETCLSKFNSQPIDQSLYPTTMMPCHSAEKGKNKNRRTSLRRQSARFKLEKCKSSDDVKGDSKPPVFPVLGDAVSEEASPFASSTVCSSGASIGSRIDYRVSIGRPSRRAAEKVRSYKEPSLITKMRRSE